MEEFTPQKKYKGEKEDEERQRVTIGSSGSPSNFGQPISIFFH